MGARNTPPLRVTACDQSSRAACWAGLGLAMKVSARLRPVWQPRVRPMPFWRSAGRSAVVSRSGAAVLDFQSAEVRVCTGSEWAFTEKKPCLATSRPAAASAAVQRPVVGRVGVEVGAARRHVGGQGGIDGLAGAEHPVVGRVERRGRRPDAVAVGVRVQRADDVAGRLHEAPDRELGHVDRVGTQRARRDVAVGVVAEDVALDLGGGDGGVLAVDEEVEPGVGLAEAGRPVGDATERERFVAADDHHVAEVVETRRAGRRRPG